MLGQCEHGALSTVPAASFEALGKSLALSGSPLWNEEFAAEDAAVRSLPGSTSFGLDSQALPHTTLPTPAQPEPTRPPVAVLSGVCVWGQGWQTTLWIAPAQEGEKEPEVRVWPSQSSEAEPHQASLPFPHSWGTLSQLTLVVVLTASVVVAISCLSIGNLRPEEDRDLPQVAQPVMTRTREWGQGLLEPSPNLGPTTSFPMG